MITYCAHCEKLAIQHNDPKLRTRFGGKIGRRYRHKAGVNCGCTRRSVLREVYEADFQRLIASLTIKQEWLEVMVELGAYHVQEIEKNGEDIETQKRKGIAKCQKAIDKAVALFEVDAISREELEKRLAQNRREIAMWEAKTTEREKFVWS